MSLASARAGRARISLRSCCALLAIGVFSVACVSAPPVGDRGHWRGVPLGSASVSSSDTASPAATSSGRWAQRAPAAAGAQRHGWRGQRFDEAAPLVRRQPAAGPVSLVAPAPEMASSSAHQRVGRPYEIFGITYTPERDDQYRQVGVASWYGPKFHGRPTANGERFDQHLLSAAHPTLPIPSLVRVTNLENNRSIIVRVNDRGPFAKDRIIDMSRAAARALDFESQGTAQVEVAYLGPARADDKAARPPRGEEQYVMPDGYDAAPVVDVVQEQTPQRGSWRGAPAQVGFYVQAGSFSDHRRAHASVRQLRHAGRARVDTVRIDGGRFHRVMLGPFQSQTDAHYAQRQVADAGFPDAKMIQR